MERLRIVEGKIINDRGILQDNYGRVIDYLRISLTDRCNLRCFYCMPKEGVEFMPREDLLSYEEILYLVDLFIDLGIKKIRLTGGEPLIKKNVIYFIRKLGEKRGLRELTLTTNGMKLLEFSSCLKEAGIGRINVSMDSLDRAIYKNITGSDELDSVIAGMKKALSNDLEVKVNIVAMRGINDGEFLDFVRFGMENGVDVRFIEIMPQLYNGHFADKLFIPSNEVLKSIEKRYRLTPVVQDPHGRRELLYGIEESTIRVGFIGPISQSFCHQCNRIRLMPDGKLKACLYSREGVNLKKSLEQGKTEHEIKGEIIRAVCLKSEKSISSREKSNLVMHRVGG